MTEEETVVQYELFIYKIAKNFIMWKFLIYIKLVV